MSPLPVCSVGQGEPHGVHIYSILESTDANTVSLSLGLQVCDLSGSLTLLQDSTKPFSQTFDVELKQPLNVLDGRRAL